MKTIDALLALTLGIGASTLQAQECKVAVGNQYYAVSEIVDMTYKGPMVIANMSDEAYAKQNMQPLPTGRTSDAKQTGDSYLNFQVTYNRKIPGKGVPTFITMWESKQPHGKRIGPWASVELQPDGAYSSPHCKK